MRRATAEHRIVKKVYLRGQPAGQGGEQGGTAALPRSSGSWQSSAARAPCSTGPLQHRPPAARARCRASGGALLATMQASSRRRRRAPQGVDERDFSDGCAALWVLFRRAPAGFARRRQQPGRPGVWAQGGQRWHSASAGQCVAPFCSAAAAGGCTPAGPSAPHSGRPAASLPNSQRQLLQRSKLTLRRAQRRSGLTARQ